VIRPFPPLLKFWVITIFIHNRPPFISIPNLLSRETVEKQNPRQAWRGFKLHKEKQIYDFNLRLSGFKEYPIGKPIVSQVADTIFSPIEHSLIYVVCTHSPLNTFYRKSYILVVSI